MGRWQFGCDVCQDVCPWNRKAPLTREPAFLPTAPFPTPTEMLAMDDEEIRARFAGTALLRAKPAGLRRNAARVADDAADVERERGRGSASS
jgi:epoxyqueuosine reductase